MKTAKVLKNMKSKVAMFMHFLCHASVITVESS